MNNDLISREVLMNYTQNQISKSIDCNDIARFPAVDAVEVVRCKNCRFCDTKTYHCTYPIGMTLPFERNPSDFCSYGKPRMDGE